MGFGHQMNTLLSVIKWISKSRKGENLKAKAARLAFCAAAYYIWHARNSVRFDEGKNSEDDVVAKVKHMVYKILYSIYPYEMINL
ncbi:unnamed protein product [Cuscuta epithymum]|nr:unnamed protein product [Cuscuta epithymum]